MKEWFKKYLGWLAFGVWVFGILIFIVAEFIFDIRLDSSLFTLGFLFIGAAEFIKDILNDKYFTKYSEKVKNAIIIFIVTTTIGISYFLIF